VSGNKIIGRRAVTEIGSASVIHHVAIQRAEAKTAFASSGNPSKFTRYRIRRNNVGPRINPVFFKFNL
jgi:hypothetical protein